MVYRRLLRRARFGHVPCTPAAAYSQECPTSWPVQRSAEDLWTDLVQRTTGYDEKASREAVQTVRDTPWKVMGRHTPLVPWNFKFSGRCTVDGPNGTVELVPDELRKPPP